MNESSQNDDEKKKTKLTPALITKFYTEKPLQDLQEAKFTNLQIEEIKDISMCISLVKLDLGENALENPSSLSGLRYMKGLRVLNLGKNSLSNVDLLKNLNKLCVLNLSHNKLKEVPMFFSKFKNLKAIILNGNQISMLPPDLVFPNSISTIVLSDNLLQEMGYFGGKSFPSLSKLSLAHNEIRAIPPNLHQQMPMLKELRLAGNKIISLPELALPHSLEILDLSSNLIGDLGNLLTGLKHLSHLKSLCLKGCPIVAKDDATLKDSLRKTLAKLRILDGERFDEEWFIKRKLSAIPKFKSKIHKSSANHAASTHHK